MKRRETMKTEKAGGGTNLIKFNYDFLFSLPTDKIYLIT